ncbi:Flagellar hook-associated protein 1 [Planctomycetes bacterium MalM25]|nr:Flagellar hook-associated protein 1 [Planctomycetes bacterium MalM25]
MSLFGSLQTASNTLQAMQIGLQVVSNNIANANTEGFIREQVNYAPAPVQKKGRLNIGLGVMVDSITQKVDDFLGEQLRDATGDRVSAELQNDAYKDLEQLLGELSDNDLSSALTGFFGSLQDTTNAVAGDALSVRNLAVLEGRQLTSEIRRIEDRARELRNSYDDRIAESVGQINSLADEITKLNIRITQTEGGSAGSSDAGALRSARNEAVNKLSELVGVTVEEQPSGGLAIAVGGEFLVFEGQRRELSLETADPDLEAASQLVFADTGKAIEPSSGSIHGYTVARDEIVDGFRDNLDEFAQTLIFEFNKVYSQGQGLDGFQSLTSYAGVDDPNVPLAASGLPFPIENGEFKITLHNDSGSVETTTISVKSLNEGGGDDATLSTVRQQLDAIDGLNASIGADGRLSISADASDSQFVFSDDTSGFLAAIGLNTFFTGDGSLDINVNSELDGIQNAGKLALRRTDPTKETAGPGGTQENAVLLAGLLDEPLDSLDGASIIERYDQVVNDLAQNSTVAGSVLDGLGVFESTLANEFQAISGVNIDEEAIDMISLQRIYQATARVISTIQEMLDTLVNL